MDHLWLHTHSPPQECLCQCDRFSLETEFARRATTETVFLNARTKFSVVQLININTKHSVTKFVLRRLWSLLSCFNPQWGCRTLRSTWGGGGPGTVSARSASASWAAQLVQPEFPVFPEPELPEPVVTQMFVKADCTVLFLTEVVCYLTVHKLWLQLSNFKVLLSLLLSHKSQNVEQQQQ